VSWLRVFAYWVVALVVGGHVWSQTGGIEGLGAAWQGPSDVVEQAPFLEAVPERIDRIRVERGDVSVTLDRRGERWEISDPPGMASPSDIADALLDTLTRLPPIEMVAEEAGADGAYGLNPPQTRLRLDSGGEIVSTVALGTRNPTATAVYAKKSGEGRVYLLGLNAQYYIDLLLESVERQVRADPDRQSPETLQRFGVGDGVPAAVEEAVETGDPAATTDQRALSDPAAAPDAEGGQE
jgi:hypothetical protein